MSVIDRVRQLPGAIFAAGSNDEAVADSDRVVSIQRWLNTWIALGAVVLLVMVGYLFFISNALVSIHHNLATAGDAVAGAEGNTKTLPGQLSALNQTLAELEVTLHATPEKTATIQQWLVTVDNDLAPTDQALRSTSSHLATVSGDLRQTASTLGTVSVSLADTSQLLRQALTSTSSIGSSLTLISGSADGGLVPINRALAPLNSSLAGSRDQLGNLDTSLRSVNTHLTNLCNATVINLLHGRQAC